MNFIVSLILLSMVPDTASIIEKLRPDVSEVNKNIIVGILSTRLQKYGMNNNDIPLVLAMAKKESNFAHIYGQHGEIGILQVIPEDGHIMQVVSQIECNDDEKYCVNNLPDVRSDGKLNSWKVRRFLSQHPKYAFETGLGEMQYWRDLYESKLKQRYWTKFPEWYFRKNLSDFDLVARSVRWWWTNLTEKTGEFVWVSHYNWGNRVLFSPSCRNYALNVVEIMNTI